MASSPFVPTQEIQLPETREAGISLFVRREDLIHPGISGNKYRKLNYNLKQAKLEGLDTLLTFGGAYSNHIAATAMAGKEHGFKTIGIIRGEEVSAKYRENPTLLSARDNGMRLKFVSRAEYRQKHIPAYLERLHMEFGTFYLLPEGGTNALAIKGCEEILSEKDGHYTVICCCVGTGGTLAGLSNAAAANQVVIGFPVLRAESLQKDIRSFATKDNWCLEQNYHFGGYAKINEALVSFINSFRVQTGIPLDPVYTGKLFYGILDKARKGEFRRGESILAIHSGGLQGIRGMNQVLGQRKMPLIDL